MRGTQMPVSILNQMQKFDQQIPATGSIPKQAAHICQRKVINLAALGRLAPLAPTFFPNALAIVQRCHVSLPDVGGGLASQYQNVKCRFRIER